MAVFRIEKTKDYTVMANHHLKNRSLSLKAKGLLSMMLSLPDEWNYTTRGLAAISMEGVDSIGNALKELESAGYIVRTRLRDQKGRITDTEYVIYETPNGTPQPDAPESGIPHVATPDTEIPDMENQDSDASDTENPAQYNTYRSNTYPVNPKISNTERTNPYQSNPNLSKGAGGGDTHTNIAQVREQVRNSVCYDCIVDSDNRERLDDIVELIVETLCTEKPLITVSGIEYPAALVKERLMQINSLHIEYIFSCLAKNSHEIRNIKRYLLATLFNAPATMSSYYDAQVRSDQNELED